MAEFWVVSGQSYLVQADNEEQAEEKYIAWLDGESCICGDEDCKCIEEHEVTTEVSPC